MKYLIIAAACIIAVQAFSPLYGVGRGGYSSGSGYGNSAHGTGQGGYHNNAHQNGGGATGHNINKVEDDFNQATNHHHAEDHNAGGAAGYGNSGHNTGGHNGYDRGSNNHGGGYQQGIRG